MKPNAGLPHLVDGKAVYTTTPEQFTRDALALVDAGAAFIGGCCGTAPDHIRALRAGLDRRP
jgi:5-methyltetrahydrofolate--homocysteine methyltransferase